MKLDRMLPLLRCPHSGTTLQLVDGESLRSAAGHVYPIIDGKPILVRRIEAFHVEPPAADVISKNAVSFVPPDFLGPDDVALHLGCGDVPSEDPRVISTDILPTSAADLVAEAETMPLVTGAIDYLVSGAVFEHVHDPRYAAAEVRRILKDGGRFYIDTAFLQGYHGYPSHFFNMTPQAVETIIVDDFILEGSAVGEMATCAHVFLEVQHRMLAEMDPESAEALLDKPLREVVEIFRSDEKRTNPYLARLSEYLHRSLAASFVVMGRKPDRYEERDAERRASTAYARRAYYAARMGLIQRHGEVVLYRRRCELLGRTVDHIPSIEDLLRKCSVNDTSSEVSYNLSTENLQVHQSILTNERNRYLHLMHSVSGVI